MTNKSPGTFEEWVVLTDTRYPIEHIYSKEDLIKLANLYASECVKAERERCAGIANRHMSDCKDPAQAVAASSIKILIRQEPKP